MKTILEFHLHFSFVNPSKCFLGLLSNTLCFKIYALIQGNPSNKLYGEKKKSIAFLCITFMYIGNLYCRLNGNRLSSFLDFHSIGDILTIQSSTSSHFSILT